MFCTGELGGESWYGGLNELRSDDSGRLEVEDKVGDEFSDVLGDLTGDSGSRELKRPV